MRDADSDYIENQYGEQIPRGRVKAELLLEDQLVRDLVARADALAGELRAFKARLLDDIAAHQALLDERYNIRTGGRRGGLQLHSFDGRLRVQVSVEDSITLGPELVQAKALIDACLVRWTEGANANLATVVNDAFAVGEGGRVRVDRVLGLRRLEIDEPEWQRAMEAINDAIRVARSKQYVRLYRRPAAEAAFQLIVLDVARV